MLRVTRTKGVMISAEINKIEIRKREKSEIKTGTSQPVLQK